MLIKGMSWMSVTSCFILCCIVYLLLRSVTGFENPLNEQPRLGLLMFIVPGAVAALTTKEAPLTVALLGALLATLCCLFVFYFLLGKYDLLQELAYATSAIFWCGSGALLVMLCRTLLGADNRT